MTKELMDEQMKRYVSQSIVLVLLLAIGGMTTAATPNLRAFFASDFTDTAYQQKTFEKGYSPSSLFVSLTPASLVRRRTSSSRQVPGS